MQVARLMLSFSSELNAIGLRPNAIGPIGPYKTEECGLVRDCWKAVDERGGWEGGGAELTVRI
jgi:hypothetical protein